MCIQVQYDSESKKSAYVSPPPSNEQQLADIINGKTENIYVMPEYVTSFLLARNIKLQFSGLDSKTVSRAVQLTASFSESVSLNTIIEGTPFTFGGSEQAGLHFGWQSVTADRTANGMIIHIPGAQVIGYYTQVMPQFPKEQN